MGNRFKDSKSLIRELTTLRMDAKNWRWTSDTGWFVGVTIMASNIDNIPTDDEDEDEDRIYPEDAPVPDNKILARCFVTETGYTSMSHVGLDKYTEIRLSRATDTLDMLKIMAWDTKVKRKLSKIHDIIKELIKEEKDE